MKEYTYWIVDAFALEPYQGNPAAIVFDADGLADERMQTIARHLNLSETVFLCRPLADGADYRARIFTPREEIPFAGHPTVASAFAHYSRMSGESRAQVSVLRQECGIGIVPIEVAPRDGAPFLRLTAGHAAARDADVSADLVARMLGCKETDLSDLPFEICSGGLPWLVLKLRSLEASRRLAPALSLIDTVCRDRGATGITTYCDGADLDGVDLHVRSFAPTVGITEDPACGSGNIALAIHRARHERPSVSSLAFTSEQGLEVERAAILHLDVTGLATGDLTVRLGGHAVRTMEGTLLG